MKFAIITDVHGNFDALQTVLDDIDNREDIDKIYNLGDNIGIGHETNKVLDTIFDRDDMEIIAGNHDEAVMSLVNNTPYPEDLKDKFYEHHQWMRAIWMKITMTSLICYLIYRKLFVEKKNYYSFIMKLRIKNWRLA